MAKKKPNEEPDQGKAGGDMPQLPLEPTQTCELECVKRDTFQQFEGPVKIVVVEPSVADVGKKIQDSGIIFLANMFIGGTTMIVLYFSYIFKMPLFISAHIAACTTGFQIFLPSSFLILNPWFGGSTQMKNKQRRSQHVYLCYCTMMFGMTGGLHILSFLVVEKFPITLHAITGVLTLLASIPAFFIGPFLYHSDICSIVEAERLKKIKYVHAASGVSCFVLSSVCLCSSFFKPSFQKWSGALDLRELPFLLSVCVLVYVALVIRGVDYKMKYHNTAQIYED